MRGVFLDLAAYVRHVHAEYLVVLLRIGTPHAAYQVSVGKNRSGVLPQQRDQAVFILGEFNIVSVDINAVLRVIYYQPADLNRESRAMERFVPLLRECRSATLIRARSSCVLNGFCT